MTQHIVGTTMLKIELPVDHSQAYMVYGQGISSMDMLRVLGDQRQCFNLVNDFHQPVVKHDVAIAEA